MQVILGSGGSVGKDLAKELIPYTEKIRLVSRNPQKIQESDELYPCDLLKGESVKKALYGAEVAYLTVGLEYKARVWEEQWPAIMKNTISACKEHGTRLVFFDNIYMYHPDHLYMMTEETPVYPVTRKGKVRTAIARMLYDEISSGKLDALIARAADFYGPGLNNSLFNRMIANPVARGKNAQWFCSIDYKHNFTYTPDAAKATALLGNTQSAFGQVWHLPSSEPLTIREWIDLVSPDKKKKNRITIVPGKMIRVLGLFSPVMREFREMLYQYDRDYVFDSSKFETVFGIQATPAADAVQQIMNRI